MAPWCSAPMPTPAFRLRLCLASVGAVGPCGYGIGELLESESYPWFCHWPGRRLWADVSTPVSPPVKGGDALHRWALYEVVVAGSNGNTHSTMLPTPVLITSSYLENALIDLSFLLFSAVPVFALLVSVQALPCIPNHLEPYCCLHLHPHLLLFHQLLHVQHCSNSHQINGQKVHLFFLWDLKTHIFQWHGPTALSSCNCTPSPYCAVPRDFSTLLEYYIVPCAECLRCFLMQNDLKNVNCEILWTADWESLNYFLWKIFSKI